ncbi:MAG: VCBS repeat-containing protein [Rhodocyclaceae bacterium]|nr:VCBS repeat-containing protein [Rhodocyclaceae bacterium]
MRIASAEVQMASSHASQQHHEIQESLRMWVGDRRPDFADDGQGRPALQQAAERVTISDAGRAAQTGEAEAIKQASEAAENDPRLTLLRRMIEMLTGRQARVFDASEIAPRGNVEAPPATATAEGAADRPAGYGVEYDYREVYSEVEQTAFSASGTVRTADGKEIAFTLELSMSRSYYEESNVSLRLGDAARRQKDPLILDFAGSAGQLSDQRFSFDIDADGKADSINRLAPGTGFLALDRNGDGRINDGSELFGTKSGDGFADLAAHDDDGNGWIDEADAIYAQLRVWTPDADGGGALRTLQEADVGAIGLARVDTPFAIRGAGNESLGQVRSSGIFLRESGGAGTIQQVDLSV